MNPKRLRIIKEADAAQGPVVYWMSRDQRMDDNWALLFSQDFAIKKREPFIVVFCLAPEFLGATIRQYGFMLKGLEQVAGRLKSKNIPFYLLQGQPNQQIPKFVRESGCQALFTDFDPLKIKQEWKNDVASGISIPFYEVDSHNIVPCWEASDKQEFGAYTLRPKLHRLLFEFLEEFPGVRRHPFAWKQKTRIIDWEKVKRGLCVDKNVAEVDWLKGGEKEAKKTLKDFLENRLEYYDRARNDPNLKGQSGLSPYLHFGQISAQRVALEAGRMKNKKGREAFLEELIVRKELSDNYCFYNRNYDNPKGFPSWAEKSLDEHKKDKREYSYSLKEFENAMTHDRLWNAAQRQMADTGKMHGYMRMYWAKKILEWTKDAKSAQAAAIYLNDKYALDGRDPNGYTGIAWSIAGLHDRPWFERSVYGKIRYMSFGGSASKFDVEAYIRRYT